MKYFSDGGIDFTEMYVILLKKLVCQKNFWIVTTLVL